MLRTVLPVLLLVVAASGAAKAQTTEAGYQDALTPSLASVARTMHATIRRELAESAEKMPANQYAFRPTADVRSFAQLIGHVINANWFFCSQARQEASPNTSNHEELRDKTALVKALNDSLTYVHVLWVDEAVRHEGHGSALMERAERLAREHACEYVPEHVWLSGSRFLRWPRLRRHR